MAPYPIPGSSVAPAMPSGTGAFPSNGPSPYNPNAAGAIQVSLSGLVAVAGLVVYFL